MVLRTPLFPIMGSLVPCYRYLVRLTLQRGVRVPPVSALQARSPGDRGSLCNYTRPNTSLPLGEKAKNCQQQWTTGLRSPRGIAAVAYAKNMPPACFLNAAGWRGAAVTDEGKGIGPQIIHSEATFSQKLKLVFDFPSELV